LLGDFSSFACTVEVAVAALAIVPSFRLNFAAYYICSLSWITGKLHSG